VRKFLLAAAVLLLPFLAAVPSANAATYQICGNSGTGYCMNAWNGGPDVKMYNGGVANDNFYTHNVYMCGGGDKVTTSCPFSTAALNNLFHNDTIVEVVDGNNGKCIGTSSSGYGYLGACGDATTGSGAVNGAFDVIHYNTGCGNALANRYWSDHYSSQYYLKSGGNPGTYLYLNGQDSWTCWGGSGMP
jgi:hypothetical protein